MQPRDSTITPTNLKECSLANLEGYCLTNTTQTGQSHNRMVPSIDANFVPASNSLAVDPRLKCDFFGEPDGQGTNMTSVEASDPLLQDFGDQSWTDAGFVYGPWSWTCYPSER